MLDNKQINCSNKWIGQYLCHLKELEMSTRKKCVFITSVFIAIIFISSMAFAGVTQRVSVSSSGMQTNWGGACSAISADGRFVVFGSEGSDLVTGDTNNCSDVFIHDRLAGETQRISVSSDGVQGNRGSGYASISADGRFVAFFFCCIQSGVRRFLCIRGCFCS